MVNNNEVLNAQEAADFLGAHVETIRRLARRGDIPAYKIGKDWRFRKDALITWAETHYLRHKSPLVLVIDDDAGLRKLMKRYLEAEDYKVYLASDGNEGMEYLKKESVDLILLDLKMPGMNGPAFLREFRKMEEIIPVIITTGYPDSELMAEAIKYGPFTLLPKPIEKKGLIQTAGILLSGAIGVRKR
jgi:excisionase family DNA binding protein